MVVKYFNVHDGSLIYTYEHCVNATPENGKMELPIMIPGAILAVKYVDIFSI